MLLAGCGTGPAMQDLTGRTLSTASDAVRDGALRVTTHDVSIANRSIWNENNWVICSQSIAPGQPYEQKEVSFGVVKHGEKCLTEAERAQALADDQRKQEAEELARKRKEAAEAKRRRAEEAQRAKEAAAAEAKYAREEAARKKKEARKPVLDSAARSACVVLANNAADVATKQDRSDLARAFNRFARQSSEAKIVEAGENLTDSVDSWTGFMWDGAVGIAADECIKGGMK